MFKIIRVMFTVIVSVIHCWLCYSTNHNSAHCHLHTAPAFPPSVYSVTKSKERVWTPSDWVHGWRVCVCAPCVRACVKRDLCAIIRLCAGSGVLSVDRKNINGIQCSVASSMTVWDLGGVSSNSANSVMVTVDTR